MFNLFRLIRRKDYIDDTATAFIEGRATEQDQAALREREASEPGLQRDLESIRQTVSLLRSVETVKAPRSFALASAPVRVRAKQSGMPRMAMAPAVFAIVAVAAVGLLTVGNLADVVHQSDDPTTSSSSEEAASSILSDLATISEDLRRDGQRTEPEISGLSSEDNFGTAALPGEQYDATPSAEGTLTAGGESVAPTGTPAPYGTQESAAPSITGTEPPLPPTTMPATAGPAPDGTAQADQEIFVVPFPTQVPKDGTAIEPDMTIRPLPQSTVIIGSTTNGMETLRLSTADSSNSDVPADSKSGVELPLWQLQLGFATFAVLMAGAWCLLQRRLTAS